MKSDHEYYVELKSLLLQQNVSYLGVRQRRIDRLCDFLQEHKPYVYQAAVKDSNDGTDTFIHQHQIRCKIHQIRRVDFMSKSELLETIHQLKPLRKKHVSFAIGVTDLEQYEIMSVTGDSMIDDDILPGDKVVIQKHAAIEDGDTVVVEVESKILIKRFKRTNDGIELHSSGKNKPPMYVDDDFLIHGLVIGVIRPK